MSFSRSNTVQIAHVFVIAKFPLHIADNVLIFLLKNIRINAVERLPSLVILLILGHLVNKKQRKHLNPLGKKLPLPCYM